MVKTKPLLLCVKLYFESEMIGMVTRSKKKICGIYKITNIKNEKSYIGQSINIYDRWRQHVRDSKNKNGKSYNTPIHSAIRKYGEDGFRYEIIEVCGVDDLDDREIYYISKYKTLTSLKDSHGYNLVVGGNQGSRGRVKTKEERIKIGENRDYKSGSSHPNAKPVIFDGIEYGCVAELCDKFGFNRSSIKSLLNHNSKMLVEFYVLGLRYKDESMCSYKRTTYKEPHQKRTMLDGIIFDNAKKCADYCGVNAGTLRSWLTRVRPMPQELIDRGLTYLD